MLEVFAKHLAIAEALRESELELSAASSDDRRAASSEAWSHLWQQLAEARAIAVAHGREVRAYDAAYARSVHYSIDPMLGYVLARESREAAEDALDALRAAFPEVVVPGPPRAPRAPRPQQLPAPFKIVVEAPRRAADDESRIRRYRVSLCEPGHEAANLLPSRFDVVPIGRFGGRCVCCNAETEYAFEYRPRTPPRVIVGGVRVPRCRACVDHVAHGNAGDSFAAFTAGTALVAAVAAFVVHPLFAAVSVAGIAALIAVDARTRRKQKRLHREGHHARFDVFVGPKLFRLTTSNPTLAKDFVEVNAQPSVR